MKNQSYEHEPSIQQDSMRQYLHEIGRHKLLTPEEERETAITYVEGRSAGEQLEAIFESEPDIDTTREDIVMLQHIKDLGEKARDTMYVSNLRLVVSVAKKFMGNGLELPDLIQEGNIGLNTAVEKFDPYKGFKFSTYATWWIKQGITRAYQNSGDNIRIPTGRHLEMNQYIAAERALAGDASTVTQAAIAEYLGWTLEKAAIVHSSILIRKTDSLNADLRAYDGFSLEDITADVLAPSVGELALTSVTRTEVAKAMVAAGLTEREKYIIEMRFGINGADPKTLQDIGDSLSPPLTRERVRQLEQQALVKLGKVKGLHDLLSN